MKIAFLRVPKNKYSFKPEKIIGMFAWEEDEWVLYANSKVKRRIDKKTSKIRADACKTDKNGLARITGQLVRTDYDFIKWVNDTIKFDLRPHIYAVSEVESIGKTDIVRFKEIFTMLTED